MKIPFKHPLATVAADTVLGYRRNGSPIYAIAGGSGEGEGGSGTEGGAGTGAEGTGQEGDGKPATGADTTDWQAKYQEALANSRKWEGRSKENAAAKAELEKLRQASLSEQEKAVEAARTEGRTAAETEARANAVQLAVVRASITAKADHEALLDSTSFMASLADVDPKDGAAIKAAIEQAIKANPKLAAEAPTADTSGAAIPGGPGGSGKRPTSLGAAVGAHYDRK